MESGPFSMNPDVAALITAVVFFGLLVIATVGMVGLVRRGGPISKVIGLTMLGAITAGLVRAAIILPMSNA